MLLLGTLTNNRCKPYSFVAITDGERKLCSASVRETTMVNAFLF